MRKANGKGHNRFPKRERITRVIPLTVSDLERGVELGARIDREIRPTLLVYVDESRIVKREKKPWWK